MNRVNNPIDYATPQADPRPENRGSASLYMVIAIIVVQSADWALRRFGPDSVFVFLAMLAAGFLTLVFSVAGVLFGYDGLRSAGRERWCGLVGLLINVPIAVYVLAFTIHFLRDAR